MRSRFLLRSGLAATIVALLLSTVQSSHAEEEELEIDGLPNRTFGNWASASQGGLSYAKRAQQWFRTPITMSAAEFFTSLYPDEPGKMGVRVAGYFVSPQGAPEKYGYMEPVTVRSVGFGLMPVEATVQVSQRRENGLPIPVKINIEAQETKTGEGTEARTDMTYFSSEIRDAFNVRILSVRVDGVDMGLNGDCRTVEPAPVLVASPEYTIFDKDRSPGYEDEWYASQDPASYWSPTRGGELRGTMTIPPFTGCTTAAGDDLSRLMTLSVSGPDNVVAARNGWQCIFVKDRRNVPVPAGATNPKLATQAGGEGPLDGIGDPCPGVKPFVYPERTDR